MEPDAGPPAPSGYLDLHDYRQRVAALYRERNAALERGADPATVSEQFRQARDDIFATHPQSALDAGQRSSFRGLRYFPYDPAACVDAVLTPGKLPHLLRIAAGGESMPMWRLGTLHCSLHSQPLALALYWIDVYGGGLFLPFRDATAPRETYGGGRYLVDTVKGSDFERLERTAGAWHVRLDFNYAYNPSCAYNYRWSCPLAPPENVLTAPIAAGEMVPLDPGDSA